MRRAGMAAVLLIAACSPASKTNSLVLPAIDPGVAGAVRAVADDADATWPWMPPELSPEGIVVTLIGCTVRYPGNWVFELEVAAPSDIEFPIRLGLVADVSSGDLPAVRFPRYEATLAGSGRFSIAAAAIAAPDVGHPSSALDEISAELPGASHPGELGWEGLPCRMWVGASPDAPAVDAMTGEQPTAIELASPEVNAPRNSVLRLAQEADLLDPVDPGRIWAYLHGYGVLPAADPIWLDPTRPVMHLAEAWSPTSRCYRLRSVYGEHAAAVTQSRGCPMPDGTTSYQRLVQVEGGWTLEVVGTDRELVDSITDHLTPHANLTPAPAPASAAEELAVLEFGGDTLYVIRLRSGETEVVTLESPTLSGLSEVMGANGETWRGCWQTTVYQAGVALVTVGSPQWIVTLDGIPLDLSDAGGLGVAVIAWPATGTVPIPTIQFPDGTPPCR